MITCRLGFADPRLERRWQLKYAVDQAALDTAISLTTLLFPGVVSRTLWQHFSGGTLAAGDAAWLVMYLAWAPLFLLLSHRCPSTWLRLRTRLVLAARLQRLLTVVRFEPLFHGEPGGGLQPPATMLAPLIWRPGTVATLLCTYILPLQPTLLCAAAALLAFLGPLPRTCAAECRSEAQVAAALYVGQAEQLQSWLPSWARGGGGTAATCAAAGSPAVSCPAAGCLRSCVAVHAWLQIAAGTLLPLAVSWALEEASRHRFQRRWLEHHVPEGLPSRSPHPLLAPPLSTAALAAWLAVCAWALWAVLAAMIL